MTKTEFERLATAIRQAKPVLPPTRQTVPARLSYMDKRDAWQETVMFIADWLVRDKPGFDRELFLTNCGVR